MKIETSSLVLENRIFSCILLLKSTQILSHFPMWFTRLLDETHLNPANIWYIHFHIIKSFNQFFFLFIWPLESQPYYWYATTNSNVLEDESCEYPSIRALMCDGYGWFFFSVCLYAEVGFWRSCGVHEDRKGIFCNWACSCLEILQASRMLNSHCYDTLEFLV